MKVLFTCGGTAGHIYPAVGVAQRLKELMPDIEVLFIGASGKMEEELVPREGFEIKTVPVMNLQRSLKPDKIIHNIKSIGCVVTAYAQSRKILKSFNPDVVVGTGGYVCFPVLRAAAALGIPTAVHESNIIPGLTTRMLERAVDRIMVGYESARAHYKNQSKVEATGTPVRADFANSDKSSAKAFLGLPADKPLVVSVWGSLGASHMNNMIVQLISQAYDRREFTLIHSAGRREYAQVISQLKETGLDEYEARGFDVREYIYDMPKVMAAADLVMCRAGASTLCELAILGKPAILIPSPNVSNDHQTPNAEFIESAGAAVMMKEGEFDAAGLYKTVCGLIADHAKLDAMSAAMLSLGSPGATDSIVNIVLGLADGKK